MKRGVSGLAVHRGHLSGHACVQENAANPWKKHMSSDYDESSRFRYLVLVLQELFFFIFLDSEVFTSAKR